jgi:flagellin-like protein
MNNISFRVKNSKKAVTPVIATIILIAATIVLALVVGAYTFGLFGSNVKAITTPSVYIYSGGATAASGTAPCLGANMALTATDPGGATTLSSISITGASGAVPESTFLVSAAAACTAQAITSWTLPAGASTPLDVYFGTTALTSGATYNYVINFANGQSVSGSLIAQ